MLADHAGCLPMKLPVTNRRPAIQRAWVIDDHAGRTHARTPTDRS
jgi:hypothetical protein